MTPDRATVRRAIPGDARALAALRAFFRAEERTLAETQDEFVARCDTWMQRALVERERWAAWVAEIDGRAVGCAWAQRIEKLPNPTAEPETHVYVTSVFVQPAHRGRGIGERLVRSALAWAETHDVDSIILWTRERSRPLYERLGFTSAPTILERVRS